MIDLKQPLAIYTVHNQLYVEVEFRFQTKAGKIVVETEHGNVYVFMKDGRVVDSSITTYKLKNIVQEWKQAFDLWKGQPAEQDYSVEQTFKEAFELGRSWR
jgi:HD superfamily phosphohydrolase